MKKSLILICLTCSIAAGQVTNFNDFARLAAGWPTEPNGINGLSVLADNWLNYDPNAVDIDANVITYEVNRIALSGTFGDQYIISDIPEHGTLYDYYNDDVARVHTTPYRIKKGSSFIYYYTESDANDSFSYQIVNSDDGRLSDLADVNLTVMNYTKDHLYLNGNSYITIADTNDIEFGNDFTFYFWINPSSRYGTILEKKDANAGVRLSIRAAHLVVELWNTSGEYGKAICPEQFNMNAWNYVGITFGYSDPNEDKLITVNAENYYTFSELPDPPYTNDSDLVIGQRFIGSIDKLSWLPAKDDFTVALSAMELRNQYNGFMSPTDYIAQYRIDEGTGNMISGVKQSYPFIVDSNGVLVNTQWLPNNRPKRSNVNFRERF